jgi:hypothetical protein
MPMSRVVVKDAESHQTYVPKIEPTNGNGVPVRLLMSPEESPALPEINPQEQLRFHHQYAMLERGGAQAATFTQALVSCVAKSITACVSSPMWRTTGLATLQAVSSGAAVLSQAGAVVAETLSALPWGEIWRVGKKSLKLSICLFLDFLDFTIGRLLGFGILFDLGCALMAAALWGKRGWWCLLEVLDITEQIDGFVPSCTLVALRSWNDE